MAGRTGTSSVPGGTIWRGQCSPKRGDVAEQWSKKCAEKRKAERKHRLLIKVCC